VKKLNQLAGPISFTADEIEQARAGNFGPAEKRVKKELSRGAVALTLGAPKKRRKTVRKK
jgi:hypothetical protein